MIRAIIAGTVLTLAAAPLPAFLILQPELHQLSLRDRIEMARDDLLSRRCFSAEDCRRRIAAHGVDPVYYEGPDEWLESGCLAKRDRTACAYLAAWREIGE